MSPFQFRARLLSGLDGGLIFSSDNALDFHSMIVSVSPLELLKVLKKD